MTKEEILEMYSDVFAKFGIKIGRMISGSKSGYHRLNPDNEVFFNANIFIKDSLKSGMKVWWGDLDYTLDFDALIEIAGEINKDLFILREMDGRFENEDMTDVDEIVRKAAKVVYCTKNN